MNGIASVPLEVGSEFNNLHHFSGEVLKITNTAKDSWSQVITPCFQSTVKNIYSLIFFSNVNINLNVLYAEGKDLCSDLRKESPFQNKK